MHYGAYISKIIVDNIALAIHDFPVAAIAASRAAPVTGSDLIRDHVCAIAFIHLGYRNLCRLDGGGERRPGVCSSNHTILDPHSFYGPGSRGDHLLYDLCLNDCCLCWNGHHRLSQVPGHLRFGRSASSE